MSITRQTQRVVTPTFRPAFQAHWERATVPELLLLATLLGAPLAIGGVHLVTRIVLAIVLVIAFAWAAHRLARDKRRVRIGLVGWALSLALLVTFIQFLPLPADLVATLNPASHEARVAAARIAGQEVPSWMPLTIDQGRTAAAFVSLMSVALAYLTATSLRSDSSAVHRMTIGVEVAALAVLAVGLCQELLGVEAIYGSYEASIDTATVPFLTTFVNPNHAAALFLLGALVAFGASLSSERDQRWHLPVGVALTIGVIATLSRANSLLLLAGLCALTIPPLFLKRHRPVRVRLIRLLAGALLCIFVAVVLIGPDRWIAELGQLSQTDLADQGVVRECWRVGADVALSAPIVGIGNGAFPLAAAGHIVDWNVGFMAYAHQGVLQTLADLGWPAGIAVLLLLAGGWVLVVVRGRKDLAIWGAAVGLGAVALQNGVDFSLWIHGVGIPAAVVLGLAVQATWPDSARRETRTLFPGWRWPMTASAVLLGALVVTLPVAWRERPDRWQGEARQALQANTPAAVDRSELVGAHPHDFVALDLAAALADQNGRRDEAERWSERAVALAPTEPTTLQGAVRLGLGRGDIDLASALVDRLDRQGPDGRRRAMSIVLETRTLPGAARLMERYFAADSARVLDAARILTDRQDAEAGRRILAWALDRFPNDISIFEAFGERMMNDLGRLDRLANECLSKAGLATDPGTKVMWERVGYYFQGRVAAARGRDREAWYLFNTAADLGVDPRGHDRVNALLGAGKAAERLGNSAWLGEAITALAAIDVTGGWPIGEYHYLRSRKAELSGDLPRAIREMQEVLRHLGHVASFHDRLADLFYRSADQAAGDRARARARALDAAQRTP